MSSAVRSGSVATTSTSYVFGEPGTANQSDEMIAGDPTQFARWFQEQFPAIPFRSALAVIRLAADKATVPFIARYRKEQTGNLDEVAIGNIIDAVARWKTLVERKSFILSEIEAQGKLTTELKTTIEGTFDLLVLEDLYLPYKRKRKTKATIAREAGLEPLAQWIWDCAHGTPWDPQDTLDAKAQTFVNSELGIADAAAAIQGAESILIERLSEVPELRQEVRTQLFAKGHIASSKGEKAKLPSKFDRYFEYSEPISTLMKRENSHRFLALRRGESEGELMLSLGNAPQNEALMAQLLTMYQAHACPNKGTPGEKQLMLSARLALKVYVLLSIENEIYSSLREGADAAAIEVFSENVRKVLLASPLGSKCILGVDPGLRTGCKLALINASGEFVASGVIHLLTPEQMAQSFNQLKTVLEKGNVEAIAVGNGTAARETEKFLRDTVTKMSLKIPVVMVSESGASIYSASEVAREEFPDLDVTVRGAISIARRLQDPLAELVKVDPKSIGVGQYQHDVSQYNLKSALERVVESCVNTVGVNVNTASRHLLAYVSGIGPSLAGSIVEHRATKGLFTSRQDLMKVPYFGERAFEQAAGFLRIPNSANPLDNTGVHPERYQALESFAAQSHKTLEDLLGKGVAALKSDSQLRLSLGDFTFNDIIQELEKPGRDPRSEFEYVKYREDIHELSDLKPGMACTGVVTNVTNFGAFVDIGVHQDGLVHISQLSDSFVKDPRAVVNPGDKVQVRVLEVSLEKRQIALTMKKNAESRPSSQASGNSQGTSHSGGGQRPRNGGPRQSSHSYGSAESKSIGNNPFANLGAMLKK
jgi:protein Tex